MFIEFINTFVKGTLKVSKTSIFENDLIVNGNIHLSDSSVITGTFIDHLQANVGTGSNGSTSGSSSGATSSGVPSGCIMMWSGSLDQIPEGWLLCDGSQGTPDLRGRFILSTDPGTYDMNSRGGEASVTLGVENLPPHNHAINDPGHSHITFVPVSPNEIRISTIVPVNNRTIREISEYGDSPCQSNQATTGITIQNTGSGIAHNNMPPYHVLAYIMKA